jgi:hypothetical protein
MGVIGLGVIPRQLLLAILALIALLAALPLSAPPARAYHLCGDTGSSAGLFNLETYEALDWKRVYGQTLELAGLNRLLPEVAGFGLPALETGDRASGSGNLTDPYIPPTLLKAIAWVESSWIQADLNVPYGGVGPVLVSHDCGYGIMQITSGMQNTTAIPRLEQAMIGGHYAFNIARGAWILADKWNQAPEFRPLPGNRDPSIIENWYYAVWSYNGFAFVNHPLNPNLAFPREHYRCDGTQPRSSYPFQELVFGCMSNPPQRDGASLWSAINIHLPDLLDPANAGPLSLANWEQCAVNQNCAPMDIPTPNPANTDLTNVDFDRGQVLGAPQLQASTTSVSLLANIGAQSPTVTVTLSNPGTGLLAWRLFSSEPWLKVSRVQGVTLGGAATTFSFYADASDLLNGSYQGMVSIESLHASGAPVQIDVSLQVSDFIVSTFRPWEGYGLNTGSWLTGDVNGDGKEDLLHLVGPDYVHPWLSRGEGSFVLSTFRPWEGYGLEAGSWLVGDFNGDGRDDLIHMVGPDYVHPWLSRDDGTFDVTTSQPWPGYGIEAGSWQVGDFNGDGRDDLIHMVGPDYVHPWLSRGDGSFGVAAFRPWEGYGIEAGSWQVGDFNGDGKDDLIHMVGPDYIHSWLSRGDGSFHVAGFRPWEGYGLRAGSWFTGDFNGDGQDDLVHLVGPDYVLPWLSRGDGSFEVRYFEPWPGYEVQVGSWQAGDFNGDGKDDLIHLSSTDLALAWYARGDGAFRLNTTQPWPGYGMQAGFWLTGDFNGDGKDDLIHMVGPDVLHPWLSVPG